MTAASPSAHVDVTDEVSEGRPITLAHVKALLERERELRGSDEELTYEQKLSLDHASAFARLTPEQATELLGRLRAETKVTEAQAVKIVDVAPTHPDDVRAIFVKDRVQLDKDEIEKIIELVRGYVS